MKTARKRPPVAIVWFRQDLRLADNPALTAAQRSGAPVVPVFIWSPEEEGEWAPGAASRWWMHFSLAALDCALRECGSRLILRTGRAAEVLEQMAAQTGAQAVFWNRRYEPAILRRDQQVESVLKKTGLEVASSNAALLHEPWTILNRSGRPFQVFTPFWRHCVSQPLPAEPLPSPTRLPAPACWPISLTREDLKLRPRGDWTDGLGATWHPGELGAKNQLQRFIRRAWPDYRDNRDRPDLTGTSKLSPHLHFGEISPRQIWHALEESSPASGGSSAEWQRSRFITELGWREFSHHLLFHFPQTPTRPLRRPFEQFPWRRNRRNLEAWRLGLTGYPLVDAGMRELCATGWMHNRLRMITASFLVKDLLISWREGACWFWERLVDADLAQNTLGWQWTAGCGADAAPYFRIFNPAAQGKKFDPEGDYVRRWVPELRALPARWIHQPHAAPAPLLARAGVVLGRTYPSPIVSHAIAREVALEAYRNFNLTSKKADRG